MSNIALGAEALLEQNAQFQKLRNDLIIRLDIISNSKLFLYLDRNEKYKDISSKFEKIRILLDDFNVSNELSLLVHIDGFVKRLEDIVKTIEVKSEEASLVHDFWDHDFKLDESQSYQINEIVNFIYGSFLNFQIIKKTFDDLVFDYLKTAANQIDEEIRAFRRTRAISDNAKTENFYDQAVIKYRSLEKYYRLYFYLALGLTVGISLGTFFAKKILVPDFLGNVEFWVLKASIVVVGITLITYFLKQSAHYQRLADQNYQTQVELQAYPSFMESIPTDEAASVRKELALKYFGREIDGSVHKDMGNLVVDQMKSTTEMVKATTDAIKKLKEF